MAAEPEQPQPAATRTVAPAAETSPTEPRSLVLDGVFVLLGLGILLPWNAVVNSSEYFRVRLQARTITFALSVAYMVPNLVGLFVVLAVEQYIPSRVRTMSGFAIYIFIMIVLPIQRSYALTIALVALLGFLDAFVQSGLFAVAAQFGQRTIESMMVGLGVAGLLVTMLYIFALYVSSSAGAAETLAAGLFFASAGLVLCACLAAAVLAYRLLNRRLERLAARTVVEAVSATDEFGAINERLYSNVQMAPPTAEPPEPVANSGETSERKRVDWAAVLSVGSTGSAGLTGVALVAFIAKRCRLEIFTVALNFVITLALFPGLTFSIPSTSPALNACPLGSPCPDGVGTSPVKLGIWLVFVFTLFDLIGRFLPRAEMLQLSPSRLAVLAVARLVFLPLFMLQIRPRVLASDGLAIAIEAAFAVTNGYVGTMSMTYGPLRVSRARDRELAAIVMVIALTAGLTIGVSLGFIVEAVYLK